MLLWIRGTRDIRHEQMWKRGGDVMDESLQQIKGWDRPNDKLDSHICPKWSHADSFGSIRPWGFCLSSRKFSQRCSHHSEPAEMNSAQISLWKVFFCTALLLILLTEKTVDYEIYNTIQSCMYEALSQTSKYKIIQSIIIIQDKTIYTRRGWTEVILYIYNLIWLGIKRLLFFMLSGTYYWAN